MFSMQSVWEVFVKRTYADRPNWSRVIEKRFRTTYIEDEEFEGYMSIIYIDKVRDPLFVGVGDETLCLADDGFIWMQYFPLEREFYSLFY